MEHPYILKTAFYMGSSLYKMDELKGEGSSSSVHLVKKSEFLEANILARWVL